MAWQRQDTARTWAKSVARDHDALAVEDFSGIAQPVQVFLTRVA